MLKVRVMGTKKDIKWFRDLLRDCSRIKVIEFSDVYLNKGTKTYYRAEWEKPGLQAIWESVWQRWENESC